MKILMLTLMACVAVNAQAGLKADSEFRFIGDTHYSNFCKAVLMDDVSLLKRSLTQKVGELASSRRSVLRMILSESGMRCDGADLIEFSKQREATEVYAYLTDQK